VPPSSFTLPAPLFSLEHTLTSGQTFCWSSGPDGWHGFINNEVCRLWQSGDTLFVEGRIQPDAAARYFRLDQSWLELLEQLPDEPFLQQALSEIPGLRCVREPWFECTANFICSSLKQISQIRQINLQLRNRFGPPLQAGRHAFPDPAMIAALEEKDLRACGLGFRARHLLTAARQIACGDFQ